MSIDPNKDSAELLLEALAVGDLDPQDAQVIARFAADPDLATRWEQLAATLAVLRELEGGPEPPSGAAPVVRPLDTMAAIRAFRRETGRSAWSWRRAVSVAALVAAVVFVVWWLVPPTPPPVDPVLGGPGPQMTLAPHGKWPDDTPLTWTAVPHADGYRVQLVPAPPFELASLTGLSWLPSSDERSRLPNHFKWRVVAFAGEVELATSGWVETVK